MFLGLVQQITRPVQALLLVFQDVICPRLPKALNFGVEAKRPYKNEVIIKTLKFKAFGRTAALWDQVWSDRIVEKTTGRGPLATQSPWFESTTKFGSFHGNLGPFHGNSGPFTQIWVLFTLIHGNSRSFCVDWFQWFYRKSSRMCFIRYAPSSRISEIPHPTPLGSLDGIEAFLKDANFGVFEG